MWSESYSANIDIQGLLHDILQLFNNCLKNHLIQNGRKSKVCLPFSFTTSNAEQDVDPIVVLIEPTVKKFDCLLGVFKPQQKWV